MFFLLPLNKLYLKLNNNKSDNNIKTKDYAIVILFNSILKIINKN